MRKVLDSSEQVWSTIERPVEKSGQLRVCRLLTLYRHFIIGGRSRHFDLCLDYFQLRYIARIVTVLHRVSNASGKVERRLRLSRLRTRQVAPDRTRRGFDGVPAVPEYLCRDLSPSALRERRPCACRAFHQVQSTDPAEGSRAEDHGRPRK